MIYKVQLKDLIIRTLKAIDLHSDDAVNLLMGTAAQESALGYYLRQLNNAPALSIFQIEPFTFNDHVKYLKRYKMNLANKILEFSGASEFKAEFLEFNIAFACAIARVHYLRKPGKLPNTIDGYARYWKKHYNTYLGKGTEIEFISNYKRYVL